MEILILHPGALGDIILSLPALAVLRSQFPAARITLAANLDLADPVASGYADRLLSLSSLPVYRLHGTAGVPPEDRLFWRSYDRIISWTGHGAAEFTNQLRRVHPCVITAGWRPTPGERRHVARLFIDSLRSWLSVPENTPVPEISPDQEDRRRGEGWLRKQGWLASKSLIAIHPGAGSALKRWPLHKFQELALRLQTHGDLLLFEGPADSGLGNDVAAKLGRGAFLARDLSLRQASALLSLSCVYVGNDSGISHLAAGLRLPCVILFGPTNPQHWAPLGSRVCILRNTAGCIACEVDPGAAHTCLNNISCEIVLERMLRLLDA